MESTPPRNPSQQQSEGNPFSQDQIALIQKHASINRSTGKFTEMMRESVMNPNFLVSVDQDAEGHINPADRASVESGGSLLKNQIPGDSHVTFAGGKAKVLLTEPMSQIPEESLRDPTLFGTHQADDSEQHTFGDLQLRTTYDQIGVSDLDRSSKNEEAHKMSAHTKSVVPSLVSQATMSNHASHSKINKFQWQQRQISNYNNNTLSKSSTDILLAGEPMMATLEVPKRDEDEMSTFSNQSQASELMQGMGFPKGVTINSSQQMERVDSFKKKRSQESSSVWLPSAILMKEASVQPSTRASPKKKKKSLQKSHRNTTSSSGGCFGWCLSGPHHEEDDYASREKRLQYGSTSHPNMAIRGVTARDSHEEWFFLLSDKLNQIYRDNTDCQPEWLLPFLQLFGKNRHDLVAASQDYQVQFRTILKRQQRKQSSGLRAAKGTIKRYLSETQLSLLELLKKQIFHKANHPVAQLCKLFRQQFGLAYTKYALPKKNAQGVYDKVKIISQFRDKSKQLQTQFNKQGEKKSVSSSINSDELEEEADTCEQADPREINLTNQLIGEVQAFIYLMRWLVYEFYQFKALKQEGLLTFADFEALEEDILFILHKLAVKDEVYDILLVLSRLLNNKDDRSFREKYRHIARSYSLLYPIETELVFNDGSANHGELSNQSDNPIFDAVAKSYKRNPSKAPFAKAIEEFRTVFTAKIPPLDKLYKLQYLSLMEYFDKNKEFLKIKQAQDASGKNLEVVLATDENIIILTYILLQAAIPDLASQIELITAFTSTYMQEGEDGCRISQSYLQLIACFRMLEGLQLDDLPSYAAYKRARQKRLMNASDADNDPNRSQNFLDEQSFMGLSSMIKETQKIQNRQQHRDQDFPSPSNISALGKGALDQSFDLFSVSNPLQQAQTLKQGRHTALRNTSYTGGGEFLGLPQAKRWHDDNSAANKSALMESGIEIDSNREVLPEFGGSSNRLLSIRQSYQNAALAKKSMALPHLERPRTGSGATSDPDNVEKSFLETNRLAPWKEGMQSAQPEFYH